MTSSRFWPSFFLLSLLCFLSAFLIGTSLFKLHSIKLEHSLLKQSLKLNSFLYLKQLNQKKNSLIEEIKNIQEKQKIPEESSFFALSFNSQLEKKTNRRNKRRKTKKAKNQILFKKQNKALSQTQKTTQKKLREFVKTISLQDIPRGLSLKIIKTPDREQKLILFSENLTDDTYFLAFLKNKKYFKLPTTKEGLSNAKLTVLALNQQGEIFFHNQTAKIFQSLAEDSLIQRSLKELFFKKNLTSRYIEQKKKKRLKALYYIQKWKEGDLWLVAKADSFPSFFLSENYFYLTIGILSFLIFCIFFLLFYFKFSSLVSAYEFLKMSFISFGKTNLFPPSHNTKNPLLYFYNNRLDFLNKKQKEREESEQETKADSLTFQEIINQELDNLKSRYPHLIVNKNFEFDAKAFSFKKFLKSIVHELILNSAEAMGALKKQELDISIKKAEDLLIFSVRDYGTGLEKKDYKKVFRMYYSTKSQLGVGLNLVQTIVQSNEGDIKLSSPEGGGLKVRIRIPLKCLIKNYPER